MKRSPIICLEGPSAVGKTTLARELGRDLGAVVIPELDASAAPPPSDAEPWFTHAHADRWRMAVAAANDAPLVVMDCDPLKGLWYNWMYAEEGWPNIEVVGEHYLRSILGGELSFPDLYVFMDAPEVELWSRRNSDFSRSRRHFEKHVQRLEPRRRYFRALDAAVPGLVCFIDTSARHAVTEGVVARLSKPLDLIEPVVTLEKIVGWVRSQPVVTVGSGRQPNN